ncbi:hypothetical protein ACPF31_003482 [Vibrio cholerae]
MNHTNNNDYNKNIGFLQIDARYTLATAFKNKETGETIPFDCVDYKLITFMIQRETYFKNVKRSRYYESLDKICVAVTGTSYRGSGSNKARIKKLIDLGLLVVERSESGKIKANASGKKHIADLDEVLKGWDIINEPYTTFNSDEAKAERSEAKQQRLNKANKAKPTQEQPKIEHPQTPTVEQAPPMQQPQAEPMLCNGDESYFTEQPPLSVYENDYVEDGEDLEVVIESQVSIEDCPKFVMCDREWQSVIESYTGTDIEQATQQASEAVAPSQTDEVIERVEPPITPPPEKAIPTLEELLLECGLLPFTRAGALKDTLKAFPVDKVIAVNKKLTEESYYCKECGNYTHSAEFCNFAGCSSIPF